MPKTPPVIYLFYGTDDLALSKALAQIRSSMGEAGLAELNLTRFQGRNLPLADLQAACLAAPFLLRRRLVIVEGWLLDRTRKAGSVASEGEAPVEGEGASAGKSALEEKAPGDEETAPAAESPSGDWGAIGTLLDQIPDTTALVFLERGALRQDHRVLRWCQEHENRALVRRFDLPQGAGLSVWVTQRAEALDGKMEPQAARLLASLVGEDPHLLDHEVQKLLAYVNYSRPVRPEDVEAVTPESLQLDIFAMVDALGQRDSQKAVDLLHDLLVKRRPESVLGMVVRQFRLLIQVREGLDGHRSARELSAELRLAEWLTDRLIRQARGFSLETLEAIYRKLADLDEALKTSRVKAETGFDLLVEEVTGAPGRSTA
ncbi:MAG: DNA polymerase III subunit delta [Anaerolineales bacterium]|jgi:DNA polymerase-3 subunit delta